MIEIQKLVSENKLNEALNYLLENYSIDIAKKNDIYILIGQLAETEKKELLNIASAENIEIARNRIRKGVLDFATSFEKNSHQENQNLSEKSKFNFDDFIGLGNEPGWTLRLSKRDIIFVSDYGEITHAYEITNSILRKGIWHFRSNKPRFNKRAYISITITQENWEDDMSGFEYPYRVEITENFKHFIGVGKMKIKTAPNNA